MSQWKLVALLLLVILFFVLTKPSLKFNFGNSPTTVEALYTPDRFSGTLNRVPTRTSQTSVSCYQFGASHHAFV